MANGHGGARPGAGRKPNPNKPPREKRKEPAKPAEPAAPAPVEPPVDQKPSAEAKRKLPMVSLRQIEALIAASLEKPKSDELKFQYDPLLVARPNSRIGTKEARIALDETIQQAITFAGEVGLLGTLEDGLAFPGFTYLAYLAQRPEYRKITERLATEMTREWIEFEAVGEESNLGDREARIKVISDELERLHVKEAAYAVLCHDGFFGRGHFFIDTGDFDPDELSMSIGDGRSALSVAKVNTKKPIQRIGVVEPMWAYPTQFNGTNPLKPDWYSPAHWWVMAQKVHVTRLVTVIGRPMPDVLKPTYSFAGLSRSQMAKRYVDNWVRTQRSVGDLVNAFSTMIWATDLSAYLAPDSSTEGGLADRARLFGAFRDNRGTFLIDKQNEEVKNVSAPLGGLSDLQAQAQEQLASVSNMPLVVLLGITPTGLNASSEGEMRAFYDFVRAEQENLLRAPLTRIIDFIQLSKLGNIDQGVRFKFKPLWALDEKGQSEVEKGKMDTDTGYVTAGILSPEEVRRSIAGRPGSPYKDIDPEEVPEPTPDEMDGLDPNGGVGGAGGGGEDDFDDKQEGDFGGGAQEGARGGPFTKGSTAADALHFFKVGEDFWIAQDEATFNENDHPRESDGKFAPKGGGGSGSEAEPVGAGEPQTKKQIVAKLLKAGTTWGEVQKATGWKSLSMPNLALQNGMKLTKTADGKYKGVPMTPEELAAAKEAVKAGKTHAQALGAEAGKGGKKKGAAASAPAGVLDTSKLKKVSGAKGSNAGGVYEDASGNQFYVKHLKSELHKKNEYAAAALYKLAGVSTLDYVPTTGNDVATKYVPLAKANVKDLGEVDKKFAQADFAVHAWLANWDAAGTGGDNIGILAKGSDKPTILDVGGSLLFRAQGGEKGKDFGPGVPELATMLDPAKSPDAANLFGGMTQGQKLFSASKVASVKDDDIRQIVKANGLPESVAETLMARKYNVAKAFNMKVIEEVEDPEFAAKHPRNPDGTFKKGAAKPEPQKQTGIIDANMLQSATATLETTNISEVGYEGAVSQLTALEKKALVAKYGSLENAVHDLVPAPDDDSGFEPEPEPQLKKVEPVTSATPDELKKAKKNTPLPASVLPNIDPHLLQDFNAKWSGEKAPQTDAEALKKIADFKHLKKLNDEAAGKAEAAAKQEAAKKAEAAKAKKAEVQKQLAEKNKGYMKELGISETEAIGFSALAQMMGGSDEFVHNFKHYENDAKKFGYPISGFECALIRNYTNGGYNHINSALRKGTLTKEQVVYTKLVNKAIRAMPNFKGTCRRGAGLTMEQQSRYEVGKVVEERAFTSASASGPGFGGNTRYVITAIGKRGSHVKKLSNHPSEDEVLFCAKTLFEVTKVEGKPGGDMTVHMTEYDSDEL